MSLFPEDKQQSVGVAIRTIDLTQEPIIPFKQQVVATKQPTVATKQPIVKQSFPPEQPKDIFEIGKAPMSRLSQHSRSLTETIKADDLGELGKVFNNLVSEVNHLDPDVLTKGFGKKVKSWFVGMREVVRAEFQTVESRVNLIVKEIEKHENAQKKAYNNAQTIYKQMVQDRIALESARAQTLEVYNQLLQYHNQLQQTSSDSFEDALKLQEVQQMIVYAQKHEDDLLRVSKLTEINVARLFADMGSITNLLLKLKDVREITIPALIDQFNAYLIEERLRKTNDFVTSVENTTDEAIRKGATSVREISRSVALTSQRSAVSIDTLKFVQQEVVGAFDDVSKIIQDGISRRQQERSELEALDVELIKKLKGEV